MKGIVSGIVVMLLLVGTLTFTFNIQSVQASRASLAIDATRILTYYPTFDRAILALEEEGYTVHVWRTGEITADRLSGHCILIICAPHKVYSTTEVNTILGFVSSGRGLLFLGEYGKNWHDWSAGVYPEGANPILGPLGISINNDLLYDPTDYRYRTSTPRIHVFPVMHPAIDGIGLYTPAATATLVVNSPGITIATGDNDTYAIDPDGIDPESNSPPIVNATGGSYEPVLAASTYYAGRAVVAGDHNWICGAASGYDDNIQLLVNIVKWLCPSWVLADLNQDARVDMQDIGIAASAFGSYLSHPRWNPIADMNKDNAVDMRDIALIARNFGEEYT